jgi:hypothetical protein
MPTLSINESIWDVFSKIQDIDEIEFYLKNAKIKITNTNDDRLHFTMDPFDLSVASYVARYQCRGLIMHDGDFTPLCIPPPALKYLDNVSERVLKENYEKGLYEVTLAHDATHVNLYWFEGALCMGTGRTVDLCNCFWNGIKTFAEMFIEVASKELIESTGLKLLQGGQLWWNLPKHYCVTIGFKHHNIHPDQSEPMGMWLVH